AAGRRQREGRQAGEHCAGRCRSRARRPGGRADPGAAPARTVQGKGCSLRKRDHPPEGRQGGGRRGALMRTNPTSVARVLRRDRVRKRIRGTDARPRLSIFRSNKHIYVQVVTDESKRTLLAVSTVAPDVRGSVKKTGDVNAAK